MATQIELSDISVFVKVVEMGGFSAAARARHEPKSSVSRRVARLEKALGTRLLHRTTRSIALTEAGTAYFKRVSIA
ncbi:MAG: LysR family transcriptional regulator, partial [Nocardioides sp.]